MKRPLEVATDVELTSEADCRDRSGSDVEDEEGTPARSLARASTRPLAMPSLGASASRSSNETSISVATQGQLVCRTSQERKRTVGEFLETPRCETVEAPSGSNAHPLPLNVFENAVPSVFHQHLGLY